MYITNYRKFYFAPVCFNGTLNGKESKEAWILHQPQHVNWTTSLDTDSRKALKMKHRLKENMSHFLFHALIPPWNQESAEWQ